MKRLACILLFACSGLLLGAKGCDGDILSDPTFHTWCGDSLCAWKVEEGRVERAPTWNDKDLGVSLASTPTAISQTVTDSPKCILFTTVADVDPSAQVVLQLDFNADGTIDVEQPIAATRFESSRNQITAPVYYTGIRFVIRKKGAGNAVLAQIRAQTANDCSAPPVELRDEPLGTSCDLAKNGAECHSGICCHGLCAECCNAAPQGQLEMDGAILPDPSRPCPDERTCTRVNDGLRGLFQDSVPEQCDPGKGTHPSGAECVSDNDCASGACVGAKIVVPDGCAPTLADAGNFDCNISQVAGGRCR